MLLPPHTASPACGTAAGKGFYLCLLTIPHCHYKPCTIILPDIILQKSIFKTVTYRRLSSREGKYPRALFPMHGRILV